MNNDNMSDTNIPDLSNQLIAITGAGFDIGRALSLKCAKAGATVVLIDKDGKALDHIYDEIKAAGYPEPLITELDLAKLNTETADLIASQLYDEFGKLDALIHCAEWAFPLSPLALYQEAPWKQAMHNLHFIPWLLTQRLISLLSHAPAPRVIFTAHSTGSTPRAYWGPYGAASAALSNTCEIWNIELKEKGFIFNMVSHDKVKTQVRKKHYPAEDQTKLMPADSEMVLEAYFELL